MNLLGTDTYKLVRTVTIRVFNSKEIHPTLTPSTVADQADQITTLGIPLPWDLQASMFPMEILIEDSAKALNPAPYENMPVLNTDIDDSSKEFKSLTNNSTPSYCFVRTLNWSEYQRLKNNAELSGSNDIILTCDFETTKAFSSTTVYVYNKYFKTNASGVTTAQVTLTGDQNNNITPNRQTISGTSATVNVKSTGDWTLSIALANGNVAAGASLSQTSGSSTGGQSVTVTLPENVTENAIKYLLTLSTPSGNRTAYITQEGIAMKLTSATTSIGNGGNASTSVQVTVESGSTYVLEVINPDGSVYWTSEEFPATTEPTVKAVNIPNNTTLSERTFTIRARNLLSTIWRDITVTQAAGTATLDIVTSDIRMNATTATVNVSSSFNTHLKVYKPGDSEPTVTAIAAASAHDVIISGIPANDTGANRTIRVDLCDGSGPDATVLRTGNITQLGVPFLALTATTDPITNLGYQQGTQTTLNIDSELGNWDVYVSSDVSGATLSPNHGNNPTPAGGTTITLTLPANNTLDTQTYTVTADNHTSNDYPHKTVTITQLPGVVTAFNMVDSEIMMQESSATVHVDASFPTVVKVYDASDNLVHTTATIAAGTATDVEAVVDTHTGAARTYTVKLCNVNGTVVAGPLTFVQKPTIRITAAAASVKGNENTSVSVTSDVDWTLTSTNGGTFGTYSGTPTTGAEAVTVTMPVNYTTSDVVFMITAQGTGANSSLSDSVNITHRKATALNNTTFNFAPSLYRNPDKTSVTSNGMTAAYQRVVSYNNNYLEINNSSNTSTTLTISILDNVANDLQVMKIKQVYVDYTTGRGPSSTSSNPSGITNSTTLGAITNSTWSGEVTSGSLQLTFVRNLANTRISEVTVTYDAVSWE